MVGGPDRRAPAVEILWSSDLTAPAMGDQDVVVPKAK
jgi:hypothetical protein